MVNVQYSIDGDILTITVDLSKTHGLSASGKTTTVASTKGNVQVQPNVYLGLNVYKK